MFITQWSTLLPMTDFYPHLPSHLDLYCKSCSISSVASYLLFRMYLYLSCFTYHHFMCDCLLFTSYAFIQHLYVVTLLPSFITLCEPVFCVCVLCVMYIVVQVVSCTGTSLLVTDSYPHSMPCISNEYLPIHHIACSTLALFSAFGHLGHFTDCILVFSSWPPDLHAYWK